MCFRGGIAVNAKTVTFAAATPAIRVADCDHNAGEIVAVLTEAAARGAEYVAFPELCITGATCGDLFWQETLLDGAKAALARILRETAELNVTAAVGLPMMGEAGLHSAAVLIRGGEVLAAARKKCLAPGQSRWFVPGEGAVLLDGELPLAVAVGDDPLPVGAKAALNCAADPELAGSARRRRVRAARLSAGMGCVFVRANAGEGESTTDWVYAGHDLIAAGGEILAEGRFGTGFVTAAADPSALTPAVLLPKEKPAGRPVPAQPFLPAPEEREERFEDILTVAALGLKQRLRHTRSTRAVIGLSGGLDSTLAILTAVRAFDMLGLDRRGILAVTMPCFGTTARTRSNAEILARELGTDFRTVDITAAVKQHFADIGHPLDDHSVTFENGQARERTQVLMDLANRIGGLVIGTGDLSELALGWCTYNGDQMSMYSVNGGIPKTLMRHLVAHAAHRSAPGLAAVLRDILDTPVSPELLPPKDGQIAQRTEDLVGPYELHDFFLYYAVGRGYRPRRIFELAEQALGDRYSRETLLKWLTNFYRRFFVQQFKRSCMPDGPAVGSVSLSPRGGWVMPSDALAALWLEEVEELRQ